MRNLYNDLCCILMDYMFQSQPSRSLNVHPRAYKEDRIPVLQKFMDDQPFASLITMGTSGLFASHIPMVLEQNGSMGRLKGHISAPIRSGGTTLPPSRRLQYSLARITTSHRRGTRKSRRPGRSCLHGTMRSFMPMGI